MATDGKAKPTVVITGASRGIGLGMAAEFAKIGYRVIATARTPSTATELNALAKSNANVHVLPLSVDDEKSIAGLVSALSKPPLSLTVVDVLVNNAGITGPLFPKETLANATAKSYVDVFQTNVVGPALLTQHMLPLLKKSPHARVINLTSGMGSIALSNDGLFFPMSEPTYRISKAATNMLSAIQAQEFNAGVTKTDAKATAESTAAAAPTGRVTVIMLSPGWVQTDMGKKPGSPPLTVEASSSAIAKLVHGLTPANTARFFSYDGTSMPF